MAIDANGEGERPRVSAIAQHHGPPALTEGEQWSVEALVGLRRAGYRPRAWVRFVDGALERSRATRRDRPVLAGQGRRWGACGAAAWIVAWRCSRRRREFQLRLGPGLVWWGLVWQMLEWHLGMVEGDDGEPRDGLSPADAVTLCRFWLVPALPSLARSASGLPVAIAMGGLTDWLDGAVARRRGRTRLGRDLDTTADLVFLTTAGVSARAARKLTRLGFWALAARHAIGLGWVLVAVFGRARRPTIHARRWGAGLRLGGLALCAGGLGRTGTVVLVMGSVVPPRAAPRPACPPCRSASGGEPLAVVGSDVGRIDQSDLWRIHMASAVTRVDREDVFLELTRSICPLCKRVIDAEVSAREGRVILRKRCPVHGEFEALVYSDADAYVAQQRFNKPGTIPFALQTDTHDGCPLDCGICPAHKQHTCLGIIEVNSACNLDCPLCFADSGRHHPDQFSLTREQVARMLDAFVEAEGEPEVIQFSGGEPTIHPEILEFVAMARERGIRIVMVNTNGIRLARDPEFAHELARLGGHVYLQFDGLEQATHLALRGRDLRGIKTRALENCAGAHVGVTLVAAVERGINDHELGAIVRTGVEHPAVSSVVFQPVTHSGRHGVFDPLSRLTNADVIGAVARQLPEWFAPSDFVPVPCCFPTCRSMAYALVDEGRLVPFTRLVDIEEQLDYLANRVTPDRALRVALERMFSSSATPGAERALQTCESCGIDLPGALRHLERKVFMVVAQDFQDAYTLNVRQLMKCCVAEIVPDGRLIPFCAYNSVGYREQVRAQLTGAAVEPVVPNARELQALLRPTLHGSRTAS